MKKMKTNEELLQNRFIQSWISDDVNDEHNLREIIPATTKAIIEEMIANNENLAGMDNEDLAIKAAEKLPQKLQSVVNEYGIDLSDEVNNYLFVRSARIYHLKENLYCYQDEISSKYKIVTVNFLE